MEQGAWSSQSGGIVAHTSAEGYRIMLTPPLHRRAPRALAGAVQYSSAPKCPQASV